MLLLIFQLRFIQLMPEGWIIEKAGQALPDKPEYADKDASALEWTA